MAGDLAQLGPEPEAGGFDVRGEVCQLHVRRGHLMCLQSITYLRMNGKAPAAVWVVVGDKPRMQLEGPDLVLIRPTDDVKRMDFRPLIGLHVDVFENGDYPDLFEATAVAIDAAKPKTTGLANRNGVDGLSPEHDVILKRTWELLCGTD